MAKKKKKSRTARLKSRGPKMTCTAKLERVHKAMSALGPGHPKEMAALERKYVKLEKICLKG
jgi:hypothetical protein